MYAQMLNESDRYIKPLVNEIYTLSIRSKSMKVLDYNDDLTNQALIYAIDGGNFDVARALLQNGRSFKFHFKYTKLKSASPRCPKGIPTRYWLERFIEEFLLEKIGPSPPWSFLTTEWDSPHKGQCVIWIYPVLPR